MRRNSMHWVGSLAGVVGLATLGCIPGVGDDPGPVPVPPTTFPGIPSGPPPVFETPRSASRPPAPIIGGTLAVLADNRTAVAADPDRDSIFIVDYRKETLLATIALQPGDEPGRIAQDAAGRVHVALRRGGALVTLERQTIEPRAWTQVARRPICAAPRGVAYDKARDLLYVACAEGELVSIAPAADGLVSRRLKLERDLRDVVVDGDAILVSYFRSAEVVTLDPNGKELARVTPPERKRFDFSKPQSGPEPIPQRMSGGAAGMLTMAPSVAWRMVSSGPGETFMVHQRALVDEVVTQPGGYAGAGCGGIVETAVTNVGVLSSPTPAPSLMSAVLPVDMAISPDHRFIAVIAAGNARQSQIQGGPSGQLQLVQLAQIVNAPGVDCTFGGSTGVGGSSGGGFRDPMQPDGGGVPLPPDPGTPESDDILPSVPTEARQPTGEAVAVGFDARGHILVQTREPASIQILTAPAAAIVLSRDSRLDTGHGVFHANSGGGLACASCHPEGGDDGRVWKFFMKDGKTVQTRRTQNLRGGLLATAPFHWSGYFKDVGVLMDEVFVSRMGGPKLDPPYIDVLKGWMDTMPAPVNVQTTDATAVARGGALFASREVGCAKCHVGTTLTNNTTVNVGTGEAFQVPSLRGISWRGPFMHNGCAKTLKDRFTAPCGGGDKHGLTSHLTPAQVGDLVAFMETL